MPALWYPGADRSQDRSKFSGITMPGISKLLLHSTETQGWPGYGDFAPQLTYDPWKHTWRQHMAVNRSASTLADPSSTAVRENRDNVVQVEIVGYCDPPMQRKYGHSIQKMDDRAYEDLAQFAAWLHREYGLPLKSTVRWVNYPASYGYKAAQRLSGPAYDAYTGILGHQHASGADHGDPGVIDAARIVNRALALTGNSNLANPTNDKDLPIMASATAYSKTRNTWQDLAAGEHTLAVDEPATPADSNPVSIQTGESPGIDVSCAVQVDGLSAGETAEIYFVRIYKQADGTNVVDDRFTDPGQVDVVGRADGKPANAMIRFAGSLKKHDPDFRLRVFINSPKAIRARMVSRGWIVK